MVGTLAANARTSKRPSPSSTATSSSSSTSFCLLSRHRILELTVLAGIASFSLFMIQNVSPALTIGASRQDQQQQLTALVNQLSSTLESYETNMKNLQNQLDQIQGTLDNALGSSSTGVATTTTRHIPPPPAHDIDPLIELLTSQHPTKKILYYNLGKNPAGFGSILNNMIYIASYQRISQDRLLVVDESDLTLYRKDYNHGMISGYFDTTKFPVVSTKCHAESVLHTTGVDLSKIPPYRTEKEDTNQPLIRVTTHDSTTFASARRESRNFYSHLTPTKTAPEQKIQQFFTLTTDFCHLIQLNNSTQHDIQDILQQANIPNFEANNDDMITVAMHVRRGDKSIEVKNTPAAKYVQILEKIITDNRLDASAGELQTKLQNVFVATDDYPAFLEVQREMAKSTLVQHVKLHTLASPSASSREGGDNFLRLLAEIQMMRDATYFIGTFSSNLGRTVTFWRGCNQLEHNSGDSNPVQALAGNPVPVGQEYKTLTQQQISSRLNHYYNSYGIEDGDEWFFYPK